MKVGSQQNLHIAKTLKLIQFSVIDYTKSDPLSTIPKGSVDFIFDTIGIAMDYLSLLRPETGMVISIATAPSGDDFQSSSVMRLPSKPKVPFVIYFLLNFIDMVRKWRASRWKVTYSFLFLDANGKDLDTLREWIDKGNVKSVVGATVDLNDIEALKKACQLVNDGKGGVGKTVIKIAEN
jgi:NADPH:quinone reductase-like Zn-dependent oxidoreductase